MIQVKDFDALADGPLVAGHHLVTVIGAHRRGRQFHPQTVPDEAGGHRVLVAAHRHLGVAVHPRSQRQCGVERLGRQRVKQGALQRPVLGHAGRAVADPAGVIGVIGGLQQGVEFVDGVHHRHRHAVVAAKPPALAFNPALLVAALMAGLAIPGLEPVVGAKRDPAVVLLPGSPEEDLGDRAVEVVVADLVDRHTAEAGEGVLVALQERLLASGDRGPVRRPRRIGQPHREQRGLGLHPGQNHPQIVEVDLGLSAGFMGLGHIPQLQRPARLSEDLRAALADMITHRRIRQPLCAMLIDQAGQDPPRSMTLLLRRIQITAQHGIDRRLERLQPRRYPRSGLAGRRHRRGQRLTHRAPMHPVLVGQPPNR